MKPRYRKDLAALLGAQAEQLVYNYSNRRWSVEDFRLSADDVRSLAAEERQLYLIKLADVHEEFLDAGHLYQPRKKLLWDQDASASWLPDVSQLIEALGFDAWAREFQQAIENRGRAIPAEIRGEARGSRILAPGWANSHWKNRVVRWLSRH